MPRSISWTRILSCTFACLLFVTTQAVADDHDDESAAEASAEVQGAAQAATDSGDGVEAASASAKQVEAGEAAKADDGETTADPERPKCSHPHWNFCEAADKCVQAWRCAAGTFPWPADSCECCARTGLSGVTVRCVQCLPKSCVFPTNCPDPNAALECRYEPPPVGMR